MRTPPLDFDEADLFASLADGWAVQRGSARYLPEGGGSHHWKVIDLSGRSLFVTVDDLDDKDWLGDTRAAVFDGLGRALATAFALHYDANLDFVLAPIATVEGELAGRVGSRYAVSVYPFLAGKSYPFGPYTDPNLRGRVLNMLIALHRSTGAVYRIAPRHRLAVGRRHELDAVLREPNRPWGAGPFSDPARALVASRAGELAAALEAFDRLVLLASAARPATVMSHGEPHPANFMSVAGRLVLVDWDTAGLAPPERDLWMVASDDGREVGRYCEATGRQIDPTMMTAYRLRWYLDDIASAVSLLRRIHQRTDDTERWWEGLTLRIADLPCWRKALG
jgi:spectinomycin phosphotransferase